MDAYIRILVTEYIDVLYGRVKSKRFKTLPKMLQESAHKWVSERFESSLFCASIRPSLDCVIDWHTASCFWLQPMNGGQDTPRRSVCPGYWCRIKAKRRPQFHSGVELVRAFVCSLKWKLDIRIGIYLTVLPYVLYTRCVHVLFIKNTK